MFDVFGGSADPGPPSPWAVEEHRAIYRPIFVLAGVVLGFAQGALVGVAVLLAGSALGRPGGDVVNPGGGPFGFARWGLIGGAIGGAAGAIVFPGIVYVVRKTRELFGPDLGLAAVLADPWYGAWLLPVFFHSLVGFGAGGFGTDLAVGDETGRQATGGALLGFAVGSLLGLAVWLPVWSVARLHVARRGGSRTRDGLPSGPEVRAGRGPGSVS